MSLWLCLRLNQLPLQCLDRSEEQAVVVVAKQRVLRANDCAAALGIREDMSTATVHALAGDEALRLLERQERERDLAFEGLKAKLERGAAQAERGELLDGDGWLGGGRIFATGK